MQEEYLVRRGMEGGKSVGLEYSCFQPRTMKKILVLKIDTLQLGPTEMERSTVATKT